MCIRDREGDIMGDDRGYASFSITGVW
jgi:hypothetical protein